MAEIIQIHKNPLTEELAVNTKCEDVDLYSASAILLSMYITKTQIEFTPEMALQFFLDTMSLTEIAQANPVPPILTIN